MFNQDELYQIDTNNITIGKIVIKNIETNQDEFETLDNEVEPYIKKRVHRNNNKYTIKK